MLERFLYPRVETALEEFPVVGLLGPRQVGKTTLAQEIAERRGARALPRPITTRSPCSVSEARVPRTPYVVRYR